MRKYYTKIDNIAGNVATLKATNVVTKSLPLLKVLGGLLWRR